MFIRKKHWDELNDSIEAILIQTSENSNKIKTIETNMQELDTKLANIQGMFKAELNGIESVKLMFQTAKDNDPSKLYQGKDGLLTYKHAGKKNDEDIVEDRVKKTYASVMTGEDIKAVYQAE